MTGRGWRRIVGTHVMNDESVVFALAQDDLPGKRAAYWACGLGVLICWPGGAVLGALIGSAVHDTGAFGLDAMFPAVILALIVPDLRERMTLRAALAGAAIALAAAPFLPAGPARAARPGGDAPAAPAAAVRVTGRRWRRLLGSHVMNDESVVFALAQEDLPRKRAAYWACGLGVLLCWPAGAILGALIGGVIGNTGAFGLDAMFPAVILALIMPALRDRVTLRAALAGAVIALAATPFLPAGLPVLLALAGVLIVVITPPAPRSASPPEPPPAPRRAAR